MAETTAVTNILPGYTFGGHDAYEAVPEIVGKYGKKVCIIGGETALSKAVPVLKPILEANDFTITDVIVFGKECSYEKGQKLAQLDSVKAADVYFAVGGGKAIDTVKLVSHYCGSKPFFTFPTIAGTCAATSKVAAVYHENHVFDSVHYNGYPAKHVFIDSQILVEAPTKYAWAGMGDTIAKHYESTFSVRGLQTVYETQLGLAMSVMCAQPIQEHGVEAIEASDANKRSDAFDQAALAVILTTGLVSNFLAEEFNSNIAHAMCYGFTTQKVVEENHLHGEIVSYGVLVLLTVDKRYEERAKWLEVYKKMGLPTKLADLDMTLDKMEPVYDKAVAVPDMDVSPYKVTKEMLKAAVEELESL